LTIAPLDIVDGWLARPNTVVVHPTDRHAAILRELLAPLGTAGNMVTDAHLAALAIEHGAELNSCDADFSRFTGLQWTDPLRMTGPSAGHQAGRRHAFADADPLSIDRRSTALRR
jgi:PIN domain